MTVSERRYECVKRKEINYIVKCEIIMDVINLLFCLEGLTQDTISCCKCKVEFTVCGYGIPRM